MNGCDDSALRIVQKYRDAVGGSYPDSKIRQGGNHRINPLQVVPLNNRTVDYRNSIAVHLMTLEHGIGQRGISSCGESFGSVVYRVK